MKKTIRHLMFAKLAVCMLLAFMLPSCNNGVRDLNDIKEEGVLRVAMGYNPLGYYHKKDSVTGVQYEMVNALCNHMGVKAEIEMEADIDLCIEGLKKGKYDLVARLIPVTTELKESVQFTSPICLDKQVLVQRKRNAADQNVPYIKSQLELPGHHISMPKNSPYIARLKNLAQEIGDTIQIDEIDNYQSEQLIILVAKGDLDYTVCNYNLVKRIGNKYPQLDYNTAISFSQMQAWALNKSSEKLLQEVNNWIDANSEKYFK
ncbi:MAG: transporter substrate-binding domain-containing protein [Paludibacteraceae bacterium]|nr:transporter substrate-binding domain-containing protein [Paludibacteraceae bacterium]